MHVMLEMTVKHKESTLPVTALSCDHQEEQASHKPVSGFETKLKGVLSVGKLAFSVVN